MSVAWGRLPGIPVLNPITEECEEHAKLSRATSFVSEIGFEEGSVERGEAGLAAEERGFTAISRMAETTCVPIITGDL